ncbi:glycoside hydrolase family 15 protein [Rhizobium sp. CFBP 8762]|uniref:glycoside hydrolase family 15 protein n=1 Tax=Rhizobium sp. CFBP 8762 TaxID=2775279 RepID=UPI0018D8FDAE|nr:glycoside hydrolase family 15 protein [Rhizobium sp. CFBP 8762]
MNRPVSPPTDYHTTLKPYPRSGPMPQRQDNGGAMPLDSYITLGDGRTAAIVSADGSVDWWCVPHMDSQPLFDRLLSADNGGYFALTPTEPFTTERGYRDGSNVHETVFTTASGKAKLTEAITSGPAGRLPWCELARRLEGLEGEVTFTLKLTFGTRADTICPYITPNQHGTVFHADRVLGMLRTTDGVVIDTETDGEISGSIPLKAGQRETVAIVAGEDEPLTVSPIEQIDNRLDLTDFEWRQWVERVQYEGKHHDLVMRSALALKLLLFSPSGAIAAAATTSLPERIGGEKNYDYRYAWVRDASYTIKAFLRVGAQAEAKAAFTWLIRRLDEHGAKVCYTLMGELVPETSEIDVPGYAGSQPVQVGNAAGDQHQHGIYGDIFETAARFVAAGNILDARSAEVLSRLADQCADRWMQKDHGIWELPKAEHYTMSKVSTWQALARAVELADGNHLPTTCRDRWARTRDRIAEWIETHCWSEKLQAFSFYAGSDTLDASMALAVRFGFDGKERLESTIRAIDRELKSGPYHYRYSGVDKEEGCFLACTFWVAEAKALLGHTQESEDDFQAIVDALDRGSGTYSEMADPKTGAFLGNMPQGLTHLALVQTAATLSGKGI